MMYHYRRNNTPEEIELRDEINRRTGAVKLAENYIRRDLRYNVEANVKFLTEAVMALGLGHDVRRADGHHEVTTHRLDEIMAGISHQLAESQQFQDCFRILRETYPFIELNNEAIVKLILREYRGEWVHDDELFPDRLIRLLKLPKMQQYLQPNDQWRERTAASNAHNADIRAAATMVKEMTDEYFQDGEIKGKNDFDKRRFQRAADADSEFLNSLPLAELKVRYTGWKNQQRMLAMPPDALKAEIHASEAKRLAALRAGRFEPLPEVYEPTGEIFSKKLFLRLGNEVSENGESKLKALVRRYGAAQINFILGRS